MSIISLIFNFFEVLCFKKNKNLMIYDPIWFESENDLQ